MSLTSAIRTAQSSLLNTALQTVVTSRNIAEASNENYSRRDAILVSSDSGARVVSILRATDKKLLWDGLQAYAESNAQSVISEGADRLQRLINGVENGTAPATLLSSFEDALQLYSNDASNTLLASSVIDYAKELVDGLNSSSLAIQSYRAEIDQEIKGAVAELNDLLAKFKDVNDEIVQGTIVDADVNDALDERDSLLKEISQYVSVSVVQRDNNDYVLYTGQGVTLFETIPREVTFDPLTVYSPGVTGNSIRIDGIPVIGGVGANTSSSGKLSAMVQMRDSVAVDMQSQLDEIARGLVTIFAESDTSGVGPDLVGLFTWSGAPAIPAAGTIETGIAMSISVNPAYDPTVGGDPEYLRDGGFNGPAYDWNTTNGTGFSDRLIGYLEAMSAPIPTDINAGIAGTYSISEYAESSLGWLESLRSRASDAADSKAALYERLNTALLSETGVNIDEEMAILIDLEQAYQASARIVQAVDEMLDSLLSVVR
ncbi:flagellar hook-associated protein FlgK [Oricola thermophila]|uniref:Flagellar hook-associated protein 1 n=1 Tax=Oricola thermophila TaxID=2742145 RepID=A0A6N1VFB7_9HYPH|nr:flagellar hook-associated protein FlgK [Oricola thermophila]QKV19626.1 flagellar hook-associated protein FlgK [Oricola thermophila]